MNRRTIVTKNRFADLSARYTSLQINTIGAIGRFISILTILLAVRSAAKSPSEAEERESLRVGVFQHYPIIYQDKQGVTKGLYADILNSIARDEHWDIHYVLDTWNGCLERLQASEIDLMVSIARTPEREKYADFSNEALWTFWGVIYVQPDSDIEDILTLEGKRVAVLEGGINGINFKKLCSDFNVACDIQKMPSHEACMQAVGSGKADDAVVNSVFDAMQGTHYKAQRSSIIFSPVKAYFAVPKGEGSKLLATIDRYMQEWKQDEHSKYNQAMQSWLTTSPEPKHYIPRWAFTTLLAVALFVLILVAWIWTLRHLVNTRTAALRDSDNRFRRLYENASYGIIICELIVDDNDQPVDFVHLRANEATAKNTGFDLSKIINQRASTMISPEELDALLRIYGGVVKTGQSATYKQHFPLYDRTLNVTCFSLKDRLFVINFIDVSEWAKAAKELEQHRDHLENLVQKRTEELTRLNSEQQLILDSVRATIWHKDTQNNILRVNKAGAASVGLMAEDIEGKSTQELFPEEAEQYYRDDLEVIESGEPKLGIIELLHTPDGRELWMLTDKIPIKSSAGLVTGIIAFAVDVTETKTAQQSLEKRSEELRTIVNAMAGRENRMAELKSIINAMRIQLEQAGIPTNVDWPPQDGHSESLQGNHNDSL